MGQDELIAAYYKAKDAGQDLNFLWNQLDAFSRVIVEPFTEIPKGVREGHIKLLDSVAWGDDSLAYFNLELRIEGKMKELKFSINVPWATLDKLSPSTYADLAQVLGFARRQA
jgi:hypothetical protein